VVFELLGGTAAVFALPLVANTTRDRLKQQVLDTAYRNAGGETVEYFRDKGYSAGSDIWNEVTTLPRTEKSARRIASWYAVTTIALGIVAFMGLSRRD